MFWSKGENRVEQTCRLLSHVWISGKRGALSLTNIKIASFPAMTLSHEFSTSPTTSSSPPSHTQQLFKRSTTGYIQCRYECLQICAKKGIEKNVTEKMGQKKKTWHCTLFMLHVLGFWVLQSKAPAEYTSCAAASDQTRCWHSDMKHSAQKHIFIRQNWGMWSEIKVRKGNKSWQYSSVVSDGSSLGPFGRVELHIMCLGIIKIIIINTSYLHDKLCLTRPQYKPHPLRLFAIMMSVTASNTTWMFPVSVAQVRWQ